jgi:hypothetical protein
MQFATKYGVAAVTQIWLAAPGAAAARIETADCDLREYDWRRRRRSGGGAEYHTVEAVCT